MKDLNLFYERTIKDIPEKKLKQLVIFIEKGVLVRKGNKLVVSGKYAAKFYMEMGVPPEILGDWVNDMLK